MLIVELADRLVDRVAFALSACLAAFLALLLRLVNEKLSATFIHVIFVKFAN